MDHEGGLIGNRSGLWMNESSNATHPDPGFRGSSNEPAISDKFLTFLVEGVILTIVSTFGLIGNILSIFVLIRVRHIQRSFSNLLLGLACFDALFLLTAILSFGLPNLSEWYNDRVFLPIMALTFGLLHTFRVGSVYVTLSVNFERFHAIVFPFKHFTWKKYLLPASVLFTVAYNLPKYFEMKIQYNAEAREAEIITTAMRRHPLYMSMYVFWSKFILVELIPYFTILICNVFIICKITKSAKFRKKFHINDEPSVTLPNPAGSSALSGLTAPQPLKFLSKVSLQESHSQSSSGPRRTFFSKQKEEHNLGLVLFAMSTLFIICQSFKIVPDLYELIWCEPTKECQFNPFTSGVIRFSHLLVCINSSANFLIYLLRGQKFREAWMKTYGCCWAVTDGAHNNVETPNVSSHQHHLKAKQGSVSPKPRQMDSHAQTAFNTPKVSSASAAVVRVTYEGNTTREVLSRSSVPSGDWRDLMNKFQSNQDNGRCWSLCHHLPDPGGNSS
ncbi:G-protein coupled receptor daf-37-like [Tigriopus californicus]|uniref:G-protein coupled receptor daf-37-like n=1 Tax=Tigriopus californicus TaxID=6832 RepID=UPI0027DA5131|nr:G-protein coupled receptor daf-37-like [Tigriopus californicus]